MIRHLLQLRILLPLAVLGTALFGGVISYALSTEWVTRTLEENQLAEARDDLDLAQEMLQFVMKSRNADQIAESVSALGSGQFNDVAVLIGGDGRILASSHLQEIGADVAVLEPELRDTAKTFLAGALPAGARAMLTGDHLGIIASVPVCPHTEQHMKECGLLILRRNIAPPKEAETLALRDQALRNGTVLLAAALFAVAALHRRLTSRVRRMVDTAQRFAAGDRSARSHVSGQDEIGFLGRKLDGLLASITNKEAQIQKLWMAVEQCPSAIIMMDPKTNIEYVNPAFEVLSGYEEADVLGKSIEIFRSGSNPDGIYEGMWETINARKTWRGELHCRKKDGSTYWEHETISPVVDAEGKITSFLTIIEDISARKEREQALLYQGNYDPLTGLPNRVLAMDRLQQALAASKRRNLHLAALLLNLNGLTKVNTDLGHPAGDRALKIVAERMERIVRGAHTVARLENDEFLVIVEKLEITAPAEIVARQLLQSFAEPLIVDGLSFFLTARIGLSIFPQDGDDAQILVRNAHAAATRAREKSGNSYRFFTPGMDREAARRLHMEALLRRAAENRELQLHYQPKLTVNGDIVGAEALIRWSNEEYGHVPPDIFIPLAEQAGLIPMIGLWVLETACRQAAAWNAGESSAFTIAVNVSAVQLNLQFLEDVQRILSESGLPPSRLVIEITERVLLDNGEHTLFILGQIKEMGVKTSIDDFGTGYSTMAYLLRNTFDELKIDRSFIADLPGSSQSAVVTTAVVGMARSLKIGVVAEGVETAEQAEFLRGIGCDLLQGYLFSRPVPATQFEDLLKRPTQSFAIPSRAGPD